MRYSEVVFRRALKYIVILPSNSTCSNLHFSLSPAYLGDRKTGTKIIEQYLNIKEVMQTYISN